MDCRHRTPRIANDGRGQTGSGDPCYFEWVQANQAHWWSEPEVEARLADRMNSAWQEVLAQSGRHNLSLRTAATCLAVRRVAEAHRQRGLYP